MAIECCSYSKTAGFTGTRCGWMVIPHGVHGLGASGQPVELNHMWKRRMGSKFNGVSYPVQRAAAAVYSPDGAAQCMETIRYYLRNASIIREGLIKAGYEVYGGVDAPYVWMRTPAGHDAGPSLTGCCRGSMWWARPARLRPLRRGLLSPDGI